MTGQEVYAVRSGLDLSASQFAQLLGVHASTLYRWESAKGSCRIGPLQLQIIAVVQVRLRELRASGRQTLSVRLQRALLVNGNLFALGTLLQEIYGSFD